VYRKTNRREQKGKEGEWTRKASSPGARDGSIAFDLGAYHGLKAQKRKREKQTSLQKCPRGIGWRIRDEAG